MPARVRFRRGRDCECDVEHIVGCIDAQRADVRTSISMARVHVEGGKYNDAREEIDLLDAAVPQACVSDLTCLGGDRPVSEIQPISS